MTAPWMPPLPEPDIPSTPIYYAVSPVTSHGPGPMYPPMWGADQMRRAQADAARAALEQAAKVCKKLPREAAAIRALAKEIAP